MRGKEAILTLLVLCTAFGEHRMIARTGSSASHLTSLRQETEQWTATAEEEKEGRALLNRMVEALGGARKVDQLTSYVDVHKAIVKLARGDQTVGGRWVIQFARGPHAALFPDSVREEVTAAGNEGTRLTVNVYVPGNSFSIDQGRTRMIDDARRVEWMHSLQRHPLLLARARDLPGTRVSAKGSSTVGGRAVRLLLVELFGKRLTAAIDEKRHQVVTISFRDNDWNTGAPCQFVVRFSDYRAIGGLVLPHRHEYSCDGRLLLTGTLQSLSLNEAIKPALFDRPAKD